MILDGLDSSVLDKAASSVTDKVKDINKAFDNKFNPKEGLKAGKEKAYQISKWLGIENVDGVKQPKQGVFDIIHQMNDGIVVDGVKTLGLKELSKYKINPEYRDINIKQQAGFAAEIISTAKDNIKALMDNTGITTFRADDRPDLFPKNDQYVDKIRVDKQGNVVERIQVKFVGKDGADCLSKLASKKFDKYLSSGKVDKIEIPKDYYNQIKNGHLIENKVADLQKQLTRVEADGNTKAAEGIKKAIEKYNKIGEMIEQSNVSSKEAIFAREHPNAYMSNTFGIETGVTAAGLTAAISTVDNFRKFMQGDQTALEAIADVGKDTATAGVVGYGTGFASSFVTYTMQESSHELLQSLGNAGVPAAAISFGIQSYDSISDYATGVIDGKELAYDLGENATGVVGSSLGAAAAGAAFGSVVPGAGTVAGAAAGLVGGMVGYAVTTEAYETAVQFGADNIDDVSAQVKEVGSQTLEHVKETMPESYDTVKESMNQFASEHNLPFQF